MIDQTQDYIEDDVEVSSAENQPFYMCKREVLEELLNKQNQEKDYFDSALKFKKIEVRMLQHIDANRSLVKLRLHNNDVELKQPEQLTHDESIRYKFRNQDFRKMLRKSYSEANVLIEKTENGRILFDYTLDKPRFWKPEPTLQSSELFFTKLVRKVTNILEEASIARSKNDSGFAGNNQSVLVLGTPCTGKTTLIHNLVNFLAIPETLKRVKLISRSNSTITLSSSAAVKDTREPLETKQIVSRLITDSKRLISSTELELELKLRTKIQTTEQIADLAYSMGLPVISNGGIIGTVLSAFAFYKIDPTTGSSHSGLDIEAANEHAFMILQQLESNPEKTAELIKKMFDGTFLYTTFRLAMELMDHPSIIIKTGLAPALRDRALDLQSEEDLNRRITALNHEPWLTLWHKVFEIYLQTRYGRYTDVIDYEFVKDPNADKIKESIATKTKNAKKEFKSTEFLRRLSNKPQMGFTLTALYPNHILQICTNLQSENKLQELIGNLKNTVVSTGKLYLGHDFNIERELTSGELIIEVQKLKDRMRSEVLNPLSDNFDLDFFAQPSDTRFSPFEDLINLLQTIQQFEVVEA